MKGLNRKVKGAWCFLVFLLVPLWAWTQMRPVSGVVRSAEDGQPLVGVNVVVKGAQTGTVTDLDGRFTIEVPQGAVLVFSYVGFAEQEVEVGDQDFVEVTLQPGEQLSEVVVTALGISRERKALGYGVTQIDEEAVKNSGETNLVTALQGRTPGVFLSRTSGTVGGGASILIRGINSLDPGRSNAPLFVIDGIEVSDDTDVLPITSDKVSLGLAASSSTQATASNRIIDLDMGEVESITVLRGATATALYGIRAANGVIVITTKKGKAGKPRVEIDYNTGWENPLKLPKVQQQFIDGHRNDSKKRSWIFYNWGPEWRPESEDVLHDTYREFFRTGTSQAVSARLTAGNDVFSYRLSGSLSTAEGIVPNTWYDKRNFSLAASYRMSPRFRVEGSLMYANTGGNRPHEGRKSVMNVIAYTPNIVDLTQYETPYKYSENFSLGIIDHALYLAEHNTYVDDVNRLLGSIKAEYKLNEALSLHYTIGMDGYDDVRQRNVSPETDEGNNMRGFVVRNFVRKRSLTSNLFARYQMQRGRVGLSLLLGQYLYHSRKQWTSIRGENLSVTNFFNLNNTAELFQSNADVWYRNMAVYGEASFDYDRYLYLTLTARNDFSSSLPVANRSYLFPSVNLSWVLSDMTELPSLIDYAKLRASWAVVGKDASPYRIGRYYGLASNFPFNDVLGYALSTSIGDENLRPEFSKTLEVGGELRLWKNRLGFDLSWFRTTLSDMILSVPISNATGASVYLTNAGTMENQGLELSVDFTPVKTSNFSWSNIINWSTNKGRVLEIAEDIGDEIVLMSLRGVTNKYIVGGKIGDLYGNPWNRTDDGQLIIESDGYPRVNWDTLVYMGNAFPDWIASWINDFKYKGFSLSFMWEWKKGGKAIDISRTYSIGNGILEETNDRYMKVVFKGVRLDDNGNYVPNDIETELHPTFFYRNWRVYRYAPEVYLQDASWIRLRNVSLTWRIPKAVVDKLPISDLRISLIGANLFLNTPFKGFDPELNYFGANSNIYGYTGLRTPSTRSYTVRVNMVF